MTTPFSITISPDRLDDLHRRLVAVRLAQGSPAPSGAKGVTSQRLTSLVDRWREGTTWTQIEATLQGLGSSLVTTNDGSQLHYLHTRAQPASTGLPILLLHGWPDSPLMYAHLIPLLVQAGHDVVTPSAPGFGFSEQPVGELSPELVAEDFHALMAGLGYQRYAIHGTDWGATTGAALAQAHPESVAALHLLQPPFDRSFMVDRDTASDAEKAYLQHMDTWSERASYVSAHLHQADTLAAAFNDSPVGLLAWMVERYDAYSGNALNDDDILASATLMWLTKTFRSSVRLYSEPAATWDAPDWDAPGWEAPGGDPTEQNTVDRDPSSDDDGWSTQRIEVPSAFAIFPDDIGTPPREFTERFFAIERFTVMPRGGHWAALEEPHLVAEDLLAFLAGR